MDTGTAVTYLAALAQAARLEIFRTLVQADAEGLSAGVIGEKLQIPASTLSFHLKELNRAGLIHARQVGRFIYYSASYDTMNALLTYLTDNCCAGRQHCITAVTCDPAKGKCCE